MNHRIAWLDVFAERPLAGNGLAVVDDADEIGDDTMLAFAKEMDLSETTFVQSADADGADYRNRIFTVATELPFAGHPSLGTAVAVARWRGLDEASFVQQTAAGLQPIEVRAEGEGWRAEMVQNQAEFGTELDVGAADARRRPEPRRGASGTRPASRLDRPAHRDRAALGARLARAGEARLRSDRRGPRGAEPHAGETPNFYLVWADLEAGEVAGADVRDRRARAARTRRPARRRGRSAPTWPSAPGSSASGFGRARRWAARACSRWRWWTAVPGSAEA